MNEPTIGITIIIISTLGYFSNWLNWRFLNYKINHLLYYFGAFVHESSHAILCILTGAKITQFKVFNEQPRVVYTNPKLPILGNLFISIAPLFGGLALLFLTQKYFLLNQYIMPVFSDWHFFISDFLNFIKQINLFDWRNLITIFFLLNIGAMISPSWKDLKNVWILIIILLFIPWAFFSHMGLLAITLILMNLIIQLALILLISIFRLF